MHDSIPATTAHGQLSTRRQARATAQRPKVLRNRSRRRVTIWLACILIPLAIVGAAAAWVGTRVLVVRDELTASQLLVGDMTTQLASLDVSGAQQTFMQVQEHTTRAQEAASDPVWAIGEVLPWVGANLRAAREIATITADLMDGVAPAVARADVLSPATFTEAEGAIPIEPFVELSPVVHEAAVAVQAASSALQDVDTSDVVSQLSGAKISIDSAIERITPLLETADQILPVIPALLGASSPQEYVVMFQNSAEARSLGGSALFFASITVDEGRISLDGIVPAGGQNFRDDGVAVVTPPAGFEEFAPGVFGRFIANATSRPSFPSAAEIVMANWGREFGTSPNGVVSLDGVMLSYLLRATGDVGLPDGTVLTSANITGVLLNTVPQTLNSGDVEADNIAQDAVYGAVIGEMFGRIGAGAFDPVQLLLAAVQGISEARFLFWSADPVTEAVLGALGADGGIADSDEQTDRVGMYINDNVGSKLSFYLTTAMQSSTATCTADGQLVHRVALSLTNVLPPEAVPGLSPSITGQFARENLPPGVQRLIVYAYAPTNGQLLAASVDGQPVPVDSYSDDGHPVQVFRVTLVPGASATLSVDIVTHGDLGRNLDVVVTPGVVATARSEAALDCSTVALGG